MRLYVYISLLLTALFCSANTSTVPDITTATRVITRDLLNLDRQALRTNFVPRDSTGVATDDAGGLGESALVWDDSYIKLINLGSSGSLGTITSDASGAIVVDTGAASGSIDFRIDGVSKGTIDVNGIDGAGLKTASVVRAARVAVGQQVSASSGLYTSTAGTETDATNQSISITTTGRPVWLIGISDGTAAFGAVGCIDSDSSCECKFYWDRGGTNVSSVFVSSAGNAATSRVIDLPPGVLNYLDTPTAGTYTYKLQTATSNGTCRASNMKIMAYEL